MTAPQRRTGRLLAMIGVSAVAVALSVAGAAPAYAATFVATDAASLSAAITAANLLAGVDTILIQPAVGNTITMSVSNPQVTEGIIVVGDPSNPPTIIGPTVSAPIFQVTSLTDGIEVDNVKMVAAAGGGAGITTAGGAGSIVLTNDTFQNFPHPAVELLLQSGDLTVTDCTFSGNASNDADANGGAIAAGSINDVTITGSSFTNNTAGHHGGALFLGDAHSVDISGSTFTGNSAADDGGAIELSSIAADSTWQDNAFTGNSAGGTVFVGGAAFLVTTVFQNATLTIDQSSFSGNSAGGGVVPTHGGVGYVSDIEGTVQLTGSTMTGNSFTGTSGGTGLDLAVGIIGDVGELDVLQSTLDETGDTDALLFAGSNNHFLRLASSTFFGQGVLTVSNNANPTADAVEARDVIAISTSSAAFDVTGTPAVISYSITSDAASGQLIGGAGMQFGVTDPQLAPLANNGGPTLTRLPLAGSPAIDAGDPAFTIPLTDQRGTGFTRVINGRVDIGAVETSAPTLAATGLDSVPMFWAASTGAATGALLLAAALLMRRRNTAKQAIARR